jgi:hypothetical protein
MADAAAEFWSTFEKETGEKVEARAIGEYYKARDDSSGLWGLLILTDKSFRFKHMPSENWISSLFKRVDRSSAPKAPVEITIARENIVSMNAPRRSFWARLFGPAFPRFTLAQSDESAVGGEKLFVFSVDPSGGFLASLEKALPGAAQAGAKD